MPSVKTHVNNLCINRFFSPNNSTYLTFQWLSSPVASTFKIHGHFGWRRRPMKTKSTKKDSGERKKLKKHPKRESSWRWYSLASFSAVQRNTTSPQNKSYMASLRPVKVKASRDTGEILFADTYAQVTGFSVHLVCVAFSTLTRSALCIRINLIDVHESVSLSDFPNVKRYKDSALSLFLSLSR